MIKMKLAGDKLAGQVKDVKSLPAWKLAGVKSLPVWKLAGVEACRPSERLAGVESLPAWKLAGVKTLPVKSLPAKWKLSRPNRPEAEEGLKGLSRLPRMKKCSTRKLCVSSKRLTFILESSSSEIVYGLQSCYKSRTVQKTAWPSPTGS